MKLTLLREAGKRGFDAPLLRRIHRAAVKHFCRVGRGNEKTE
jgi:hypothetical protein